MAKNLTDKQKSMLRSTTTGLTSGIGLGTSLAQIKDTSADESFIENVGSTQFSGGDTNALLSSFNANSLARTNYTADEIRGFSDGQLAGNVLSSTASGALSGAMKGGWIGALVEGGANLIGGTIGALAGNRKAENKANELNKLAEEANKQYLNNFANAASNTQNKMFNNSLLNIAAEGGFLDGDSTDWDNTLSGRLISYTENRDSVGFNPATRRWYAPEDTTAFDVNNRGMGVDINHLPKEVTLHTDKKGSYLTEQEERKARYTKLDEAEKSYNQRLKYAQSVMKSTKAPSEYKKALVMDAIYNFGAGAVANKLFEDKQLMNLLLNGTNEAFKTHIQQYWDKDSGKAIKKRADRINKQNEFFKMNNKAYGGPLFNHSGDWSNGLTFINEGGLHSENPLGGVPVGVDSEGTPNLVEEGEIIWNDYVFSNRLKPTKKQLETAGYHNKYNNWTFAKIVEDVQKISAETPVDKISTDTLNDNLMQLVAMQEESRMKKNKKENNKFDYGGSLYDGLFTVYGDSGKPIYLPTAESLISEYNLDRDVPIEDVQIQDDIDIPEFDWSVFNTPSTNKLSETDEDIQRKIDEENALLEPIWEAETKAITDSLSPKNYNDKNILDGMVKQAGQIANDIDKEKLPLESYLRYASPLLHGINLINNLKKPDYSDEQNLIRKANNITKGSYTPLGNTIDLQLIDQNSLINPIIANANATNRFIQQNAVNAGSAISSALSNNYLTNNSIGNALIQGIQANNAIKNQEAQFYLNRDQANSQMGLQALNMTQQADQIALDAMYKATQSKQNKDKLRSTAIGAEAGALAKDLSAIGRESLDRMDFDKMLDLGYIPTGYKDGHSRSSNIVKYGGLLTRNRRRK